MGDPFADLLTQFKGGEPPQPPQPKNKGNQPLDFYNSRNNSAETGSTTLSQPAPITSSTNSKIDDDLEQLFGIKSDKASSDTDDKLKANNSQESDSTFDLLQTTPEKSKEKFESESEQVVDEVRDMEVAKLMSLGYSIDSAIDSYEKGILYEEVVEERKRKKLRRRQLHHQMAQGSWDRETPSPNIGEHRESSVDLFSIASGFLDKGKKFVDQFSLFPDEESGSQSNRSDRLKQSQFYFSSQPEPTRRPPGTFTTSASGTQGSLQVELESATKQQHPIDHVQEGDLLGDFHEKISLQPQGNSAESMVEGQSNAALLDFDDIPPAESNIAPAVVTKQRPPLSTVPITEIELSGYNEFKDRAGGLFKTGDYVVAIQEYEKSANTLPHGHPLRIISYSNLIASQLKTGQYKEGLHIASMAIGLFPEDTKQWTQPIQNSEPLRTYRDMWPKIMQRRAEALEYSENFKEALNAYTSLIEKNFSTDKILDGKRRCQKMINPEKPRVTRKPVGPAKNSSLSPGLSDKRYENLERVKENNRKKAEEDSQRSTLYDQVHEKIGSWEAGRSNDIRHLLSSLQDVLTWTNWKPVSPADLVMPKKVKVTYLKAVSKTHPDKVPSSLPLEQRMVAESVFSSLSSAWERFKSENDIN